MIKNKDHIVIIGAGITGLVTTYKLLKQGKKVTILEKENESGGFARSIGLSDGSIIDTFYHFICKTDYVYLELLHELGLGANVHWVPTKMAYLLDNTLSPFGGLGSLIGFPNLSVIEKVRYAIFVAKVKIGLARPNQAISAKKWLIGELGLHAYEVLWKFLLEKKFWEYAEDISAEWLLRRIKRVADSRNILMQEEYGFLEGGSKVLIQSLKEKIISRGGVIRHKTPVIDILNNKQLGLLQCQTPQEKVDCSTIISTIPLPVFSSFPAIKADSTYSHLQYTDVLCCIFLLKHQLSSNFWVNVNQGNTELSGVIEFSNLAPMGIGQSLVYVPIYTTKLQALLQKGGHYWKKECIEIFTSIQKNFSFDWILDYQVVTGKYAQPVCFSGYQENIPTYQTKISNVFATDTSHFFPEDRSFHECVLLSEKLVKEVIHSENK